MVMYTLALSIVMLSVGIVVAVSVVEGSMEGKRNRES